jgi:hypothetical protein
MAHVSSGEEDGSLGAGELRDALRRGSKSGTIVFDGGTFEVLYGDPRQVVGRGVIAADFKRVYVQFGLSSDDGAHLYFDCYLEGDCLVLYSPVNVEHLAFRISGKPEPGPFRGKITLEESGDWDYWYEGFGVKVKIRRENIGFDPVLIREEEINSNYVMVTYAGRGAEGTYVMVDTHYSFVIDKRKKTVWGPHHRGYYESLFNSDYIFKEVKPVLDDWWPAPRFYGERTEGQDEKYDDQPRWRITPESISFLGSESSGDSPESLDIRE